jgi:hypothetical protein
MAVIICIAGAVVGLIIGTVSRWLVLPMVLRSLEARLRERDPTMRLLPAALSDPHRLRALIIFIYRYVIPLVFAWVGAIAAYYLFIADGAQP